MIMEKVIEGQQITFYNLIITSIIEDIYDSIGKRVSMEDLKEGYSYNKNVANKKNTVAKATIKKCKKPIEFVLEMNSHNGTTVISYKTKKLDDNNFMVTYQEEYRSITNRAPNKFIWYVHERRIKNRTQKLLKTIQNLIYSIENSNSN